MYNDKLRYLNNHDFGKLELVDKEIFFISFNRRDTLETDQIEISSLIYKFEQIV